MRRIALIESDFQAFKFPQIVALRLNSPKLGKRRFNHASRRVQSEESIPACRRINLRLRTRLKGMENAAIHRERVKRDERRKR